MLNAGAVGDDQAWPVITLSFLDGIDGLCIFGAKGHLCHIDVAIAHGDQSQILLADGLTAGGEFGNRTDGRGLGGLSTSVGVNLGVQHQHVDVLAGSQHVVQTAITDVIGPTVTTDNPDAFVDQIVSQIVQTKGGFGSHAFQLLAQHGHVLTLVRKVLFGFHGGFQD